MLSKSRLHVTNYLGNLGYYIMRYGFHEGHTSYRADPIATACIFGLKSVEEIENAFRDNLYRTLVNHFTEEDANRTIGGQPLSMGDTKFGH